MSNGEVYHGFVIGAVAGIAIALTFNHLRKLGSMFDFEIRAAQLTKKEVLALRKKHFSATQSISYENSEPLMVIQGKYQYLQDAEGDWYLDTRNNVAHIGHQHGEWVGAVHRQLLKTNSNTRYLHPYPVMLAEKLLSGMPASFGKVFFVNSGSEANDLALRLAQGRRPGGIVVAERAYHGHTASVIGVSPYKFQGIGGKGKPSHVQVMKCPDTYRDMVTLEEFKADCERCCQALGAVSCLLMESGMSVAGVVLPPPGYLEAAYATVRSHGGVCIADEVQVGFGRMGEWFWGFEQQNVVPDIVTVAKPFGNGIPLAAVICSDEVASTFENGMEYFNTFGGNPVSCAAGLAMLEVMEKENLQENARTVGMLLRKNLHMLKESSDGKLIGDIRGCGLFIGVEFVTDRKTKKPATLEVSFIASVLLQEHRILTSCDGKHNNVLVIKPPMTFTNDDVHYFVGCLKLTLQKAQADESIQNMKLTPT